MSGLGKSVARYSNRKRRAAMAASAAPPEPECSCGPWQIGQPQGHLPGCPRAAPPEPPRPLADNAADWHRYLHQEGMLVEDSPGEECGPWHHRVFLAAPPEPPRSGHAPEGNEGYCICGVFRCPEIEVRVAAPEGLDVDRLEAALVLTWVPSWFLQDGPTVAEAAADIAAEYARLSESGSPPRFDHDGMWRHHHDADTGEPVWWENVEQFGGEKRQHIHHHRGGSGSPPPERCLCAHWMSEHRINAHGPCRSCACLVFRGESAPTPPGEERP